MTGDVYFGNQALPDTERSFTAPFGGGPQNIGTALTVNPVIIIFDNQTTVSSLLYINGVAWKTFVAGEVLLLDMKSNQGEAKTYTFNIGTQFSCDGVAGTGSFRISILYAGP